MNVLAVVDHASNAVPPGVDLGLPPAVMASHIAWDPGAAALADALGYPSHRSRVSRLVIDVNRPLGNPALIPAVSDGVTVPGNPGDVDARVERYWRPYHAALAARVAAEAPTLLLSLHSFTPRLASRPEEARPWEVGVLYNTDDRAARIALPLLGATGLVVGDQLPYSGRVLNHTMNLHGEGTGTPYLGLEVRQDLLADECGVARMSALLRPVVETCAAAAERWR